MSWINQFFKKKGYVKDLEYVIFGRYYNDDYGLINYSIYKLTKNQLFIDNSEIWHKKYAFLKKYKFRGSIASKEKFEIAKELLFKVPKKMLSGKLKRHGNNFGNKHQDHLIIELFDGTQKKIIVIDDYIIETKKLPKAIKAFRILVENTIKEITLME